MKKIEEHFSKHTEEAVMKRFSSIVESSLTNFWPHIDIHPDIIKLPKQVRHESKIAENALKDAIPKIRSDLKRFSRTRNENMRRSFRGAKKDFERMVERGHLVHLELDPRTFQVVGGRIGAHASVFVPNQQELDHMLNLDGHDYWSENNVGDSPLVSLIMTRWILEYHNKLLAIAHGQK